MPFCYMLFLNCPKIVSLAEAARDILDNLEILLAVLFPYTTTTRAITYNVTNE